MTSSENLPDIEDFAIWAEAALNAAESPRRSLSIRIVEAEEIQTLNREFRGTDCVTNVLSFPFIPIPEVEENWLGDVVICASVVVDEALMQGKALLVHWAHMVIHGILHLCGFDHVDEAEAQAMESLEVQLLETLGYPNPYQLSDLAGVCREDVE